MPSKILETNGNQSLADFQTVVQQQEEIFGPLTALGMQGSNNTMTFDIGPRPANLAKLETYDGDAPPTKDGHGVLCSGGCWVDGQPANVVAYRQN